jgi:hypothetical protein
VDIWKAATRIGVAAFSLLEWLYFLLSLICLKPLVGRTVFFKVLVFLKPFVRCAVLFQMLGLHDGIGQWSSVYGAERDAACKHQNGKEGEEFFHNSLFLFV